MGKHYETKSILFRSLITGRNDWRDGVADLRSLALLVSGRTETSTQPIGPKAKLRAEEKGP